MPSLRSSSYFAGVALAALLGCSPVKDSSNVPDAPIDGTDMRAPMIVSSVPANMGTKVSILSPLSVFVDESLDPATVTAATVKLTYDPIIPISYWLTFDIIRHHGPITGGPTPVKGTVSYDAAAKKISFVPAVPLAYGTLYKLSVAVKDKAGLELKGDVSFLTYINTQTRTYNFTSTGTPSSWQSAPVDTVGRMSRRLQSNAPGTDTVWFTADDPVVQIYGFNYTPDGRLIDERQVSAGSDGVFNTPDDQTSICVSYRYDAMRLVTERTYASTAGPDAMFCTADDVPVVNTLYAYTGTTMTGWVYYSNAGTDAVWRTPDDRCSVYWDYNYDADGYMDRPINKACGSDGLPRTADDATLYQYYYDYDWDASHNLTKTVQYVGAGPDGIWLNADDQPNTYTRFMNDAKGLVTQTFNSFGPGTDGIWGTNDDPGSRVDTHYNQDNLPDETTQYSAGTDNILNTADDVITAYSKIAYDVNGNRVDQKAYSSGNDGIYKTADDRVITDFDFDLTR